MKQATLYAQTKAEYTAWTRQLCRRHRKQSLLLFNVCAETRHSRHPVYCNKAKCKHPEVSHKEYPKLAAWTSLLLKEGKPVQFVCCAVGCFGTPVQSAYQVRNLCQAVAVPLPLDLGLDADYASSFYPEQLQGLPKILNEACAVQLDSVNAESMRALQWGG